MSENSIYQPLQKYDIETIQDNFKNFLDNTIKKITEIKNGQNF